MKQKNLIQEKDWDCLVILDACRYDYFEKVYDQYLNGELRKVNSVGSDTPTWLVETFDNRQSYEDVVYVSANPFVNSQGVEFVEDFDASKIFYKIFDVWDWKFNFEYMTVLPEVMGKAARLAKAKYPDNPLIVHFMQPHWPYVGRDPFDEAFPGPLTQAWEEEKNKTIFGKMCDVLEDFARSVFGDLRVRRFKDFFNLRRLEPEELFARKYGVDFLRKSYEENLHLVLEEVVKLVERVPGDIVVTADHGEFLGEDGLYSHQPWSDSPILREVPWFRVECCKKI